MRRLGATIITSHFASLVNAEGEKKRIGCGGERDSEILFESEMPPFFFLEILHNKGAQGVGFGFSASGLVRGWSRCLMSLGFR
jgi:hypothetical protein